MSAYCPRLRILTLLSAPNFDVQQLSLSKEAANVGSNLLGEFLIVMQRIVVIALSRFFLDVSQPEEIIRESNRPLFDPFRHQWVCPRKRAGFGVALMEKEMVLEIIL